MQVTFKNTGMIEYADIELNGLTVIAGENDTGKSTVGKLLFAIIKTFRRYKDNNTSSPEQDITQKFQDYRDTIKKVFGDANPTGPALIEPFFKELEKDALDWMHVYGTDSDSEKELKSHIAEKTKSAATTLKQASGIDANLENIFAEISGIINKQKEKADALKISFKQYTYSVFGGAIANKFSIDRKFSITGQDNTNTIFEISGTDESAEVRLNDKPCFDDATFIESPIPLDIADTIRLSKTVTEVEQDIKKKVDSLKAGYVSEYMKDFILKITDQETLTGAPKIVDTVKETIGGDFYYDRQEREFIFKKKGETFKTATIASGIKYLGVISLLLKTGFFNKTSLLIIDEPETNMHPKWQVQFAAMLVQLVKEGNYVMVTSHSPYFIEALKLYSDEYLEEDNVSFYISRRNPNPSTSRIDNVTHDISPIFEILSEPFDELERLQIKEIP